MYENFYKCFKDLYMQKYSDIGVGGRNPEFFKGVSK